MTDISLVPMSGETLESRERSSSTCSKNVLLVWPLHPVTRNGTGLGQCWQSLGILHMAQQYYHTGILQVKKS